MGKPMATSQDFCNWVCGPDLDPEFLMYAFMASQDYLRNLGSGAVHKTIYMPTIQSFHICAPGIEEQRRIARALKDRLAVVEQLPPASRLASPKLNACRSACLLPPLATSEPLCRDQQKSPDKKKPHR